ncbi:lytic transglycosylase domain-containing protein [Polynucleobacter sp. UK-FUSCHL-C3]|uniref:Lytic transglycosylase domain-containing protein n=1 Tax=Polynucleobacter sp. UK-FUSCHL-C3 TaxID=2955208 RepID=A0AAU8A3I3_9BURK
MNQYIFDKLKVLDLHKMDLLAALQRWGQSMLALLVAAVLAVWLIGPKTGAGLFDLAHYLVPAEARALILGTDSAEILTADESASQLKLWNSAGRDIPSIASQAALIPTHLVDHSAMDRGILRTEAERKAVASHLAKKFQLSPEDTAHYVAQAIAVGKEVNLDPTLILAVMATESSFNPRAESRAGAQGLMQVRTHVHQEKFEPYGGPLAAFIPEANIRVGALILKACIAKAGSLEAGLKNYLGAPNAASGINTYTGKVFSEREELRSIARRFSNNV